MLSLMISRPRQPGNDIDVCLSPLIEDLTKMWDEGGFLCLKGIEMRHSSCVQCYFVPLMTFQHTGILMDTVLRAIVYALFVKKT